jgi:outer membrane immunogenic protein
MRFSITGAAAVLLLASFSSAEAQAPAAPPPPDQPQLMMGTVDWSGFYAGASAGGASSSARVTSTESLPTPPFFAVDLAAVSSAASPSLSVASGYLGAQVGYNQQYGNFVLGLEADFGDLLGNGGQSTTQPFPSTLPGGPVGPPTSFFSVSTAVNPGWLLTVRPRLGWTWDNWLVYGTGGLAVGQENVHQTLTLLSPFVATNDFSTTQVGWTAGAGVEYALAGNWSLKAEYLHVDLGSSRTVSGGVNPAFAGFGYPTTLHFTSEIAKIGFNYHFNAPPPPPPAPAAAPAPPPVAPKVFIVFFDWDKDVITPEGEQIIQQAAAAYKSGAPVQLQVTGYTDRSGSPGYNQRLSERRANNVAKALAALGVPKNEMVVTGRGENDNRVPTAPGVREPQNRRVEIVAP